MKLKCRICNKVIVEDISPVSDEFEAESTKKMKEHAESHTVEELRNSIFYLSSW